MKVKFFDFASDGDLASFFDALGLKVETIRGSEIAVHLMNNKLEPNQIVLINSLYVPQAREIGQNLYNYVNEGGRLIIFNSSPQIVGMIFPGKIQPAPHSTCVSAKLKITGDREHFTGYKGSEEINLEYGRYPVGIYDRKGVQVLAKIQAQTEEPLLLKFAQGSGMVYLYVSKLFTKEKEIVIKGKVWIFKVYTTLTYLYRILDLNLTSLVKN